MWCLLLALLCGSAEAAEPTPIDPMAYTSLGDGLQFVDLKPGDGEGVTPGARVTVHFATWLEDGTQVYDSRDGAEPFIFNLGTDAIIEGWNRGLVGQRVGGVRQLVVPPGLAYGATARGEIPGNATLRYEVELLAVGRPRLVPPMPDVSPARMQQGVAGVQFRDIRVGTGDKAQVGATIQVESTSWGAAGQVLRSTFLGEGPRDLKVGDSGLEPWLEVALLDVREGGTRVLLLPPDKPVEARIVQFTVLKVDSPMVARGKRAQPEVVPEDSIVREENGLAYADLVVGDGEQPRNGQIAVCRYTGWVDDKPLDSSYDRDGTFEFQLGRGQVVRGWELGVATMRVGGVRQIHVPPHLGYGRGGHPPLIKRDSKLVFEIELVELRDGS